jgi:hypothetical protein
MTIWKYRLQLIDEQVIAMPSGAHILTIQMQNGSPHIWALVNPEKPETPRHFATYGTGHEVSAASQAGDFIGTYQLINGGLVFHVFEFVGQSTSSEVTGTIGATV